MSVEPTSDVEAAAPSAPSGSPRSRQYESAEGEWFIRIGESEYKAPNYAVLRQWISEGRIPTTANVWHPMLTQWTLVPDLDPQATPQHRAITHMRPGLMASRFEISERFRSARTLDDVREVLDARLSKIAERVTHERTAIIAHSIAATFGSINRKDFAKVRVHPRDDGYLIAADVIYQPSGFFWLFFIIGLFTPGFIWFLIPIGFYLYQKGTVRDALQQAFKRVRDEMET
jgi:hypothetical protein